MIGVDRGFGAGAGERRAGKRLTAAFRSTGNNDTSRALGSQLPRLRGYEFGTPTFPLDCHHVRIGFQGVPPVPVLHFLHLMPDWVVYPIRLNSPWTIMNDYPQGIHLERLGLVKLEVRIPIFP